MGKLKYMSSATVDAMRAAIGANVHRYRAADFDDLVLEGDWSIELNLEVDLEPLEKLDHTRSSEAEIDNSKLVWQAFQGLTPSLACEEGVWVRLTHLECLPYARSRWLNDGMSNAEIEKTVLEHFFADTLTKRRDSNAISRLWWNAYVADVVLPSSGLRALDSFLRKADLRSNFVERSLTVSRPAIAAGIIRAMERETWITEREENFRAFMRTVNRLGGGVVFEAMPESDIDSFMISAALRAGMPA